MDANEGAIPASRSKAMATASAVGEVIPRSSNGEEAKQVWGFQDIYVWTSIARR